MHTGLSCATTLAVLSSLACHTTRIVTIDEAPTNPRVSVTFTDQTVVTLTGPKVLGTKLTGFVNGRYDEFPVAKVKEMRVQEPAPGRTAALVAAGVIAFGAFAYWITSNGADSHARDVCDENPDLPECTQ